MAELTRRHVVTGAAAITAATAAPLPFGWSAQAAAPPAGKQAPGFYRYKVGDFELTQVTDGSRTRPLRDGFVRNVSKEQAIAAAEAAYMPKGQFTVSFNPVIVNTGSKLVLIDGGYGPDVAPTVGLLAMHMAAAGIDPLAIDIVVLSHLHHDHINGLKTAAGALAFPNAEIKVPALDWAFWMNDDNMGRAADDIMKGFFAATRRIFPNIADRVTRYEWGQDVAPGITALDASGHTPGHTAFAVASGSARMLVQSDVTNIPELFLRHPDWHVVFDIDPDKAAATRRKFYDMAAAEKTLVAGYHFPFPALGYVEKDGAGYRLVPVAWNAVL